MTILSVPLTQGMVDFVVWLAIVIGLIPITLLIGHSLSDLMVHITGGGGNDDR